MALYNDLSTQRCHQFGHLHQEENMLITDQYRELNAQLHNTNPSYGVSSSRWAPLVAGLAENFGTRDILDYGCGKGLLKSTLGTRSGRPAAAYTQNRLSKHRNPASEKDSRGWPQRTFNSAAVAVLAPVALATFYLVDGGERAGRIHCDRCSKKMEPLGVVHPHIQACTHRNISSRSRSHSSAYSQSRVAV